MLSKSGKHLPCKSRTSPQITMCIKNLDRYNREKAEKDWSWDLGLFAHMENTLSQPISNP